MMGALIHGGLVALAVVLVFSGIILAHELGHFVMAKLAGVRVEQFAIGFGPALVAARRGDTLYAVRALPLGGFVKLAGMDTAAPGPRDFNGKPLWQRFLIIIAGAAMNLILPIVIFSTILAIGAPVRVEEVIGVPAREAGIVPGDLIRGVDGRQVLRHRDLQAALEDSQGRPVTLAIEHQGRLREIRVTPYPDHGRWLVGVRVTAGLVRRPPLQALLDGTRQSGEIVTGTLTGLARLLSGSEQGGVAGPRGLVGPVGILNITADQASQGIFSLFFWMAFLSISLGLLNILPFPGLDGGRAAFLVLELVRRRRVDPLREQTVHYIGLAILLALIMFVSYNDIVRIVTRG